jgi:hypothetical protein
MRWTHIERAPLGLMNEAIIAADDSVGAQCLLVEEAYGVRPTRGLVVAAGGRHERVDFTSVPEQRLHETVAKMRTFLLEDAEPGPRRVARMCHGCGFREPYWDLGGTAPRSTVPTTAE